MAEHTSEELLAMYDNAPLNARYWTSFAIMSGVLVLDFFDFFLIDDDHLGVVIGDVSGWTL